MKLFEYYLAIYMQISSANFIIDDTDISILI